ncbi:calmodulin-binding family protein isoform X2 [Wolffia australiana]
MGISFSCPGANCAFDSSVDSVLMRSISFKGDDLLSLSRSSSFNGVFGPGKMTIEGSLSFNARDPCPFRLETKVSFKAPMIEPPRESETMAEAAVKLQKVYRSFRTRRQLADWAVLAEQRWSSLLDFAVLKRSSVSFFDVDQPESVVSRWSRARTRAAKVGKGLSKNKKARKLALQHWLEAIDPRHRYGHNLHFYYLRWLQCDSRQPFFYWLDVGEGKDVNLENHCPRWKLQQQCIQYLGQKEREAYEVVVEDGKLFYKNRRQPVDTTAAGPRAKWIFVLSTSKTLYVGLKKKGTFQHSSFLAGGATSAAGRLVVERGTLKAVWPHSGHYRPTEENFQELLTFLSDNGVDINNIKKDPEEEDSWEEGEESLHGDNAVEKGGEGEDGSAIYQKKNLFLDERGRSDAGEAPLVPPEKIIRRMTSKKEMGSCQLGRQLAFRWTTGAGPRIGCVRDYPPELQHQALEQVNFSARSQDR